MTTTLPRICLVEDDEVMGEALADRLALENFDCCWYKTGNEAMTAIAREPYTAVVCDVQLPDINGEDLFTKLRQSVGHLPPFLFITGYGKIDSAVRLLKLGAVDYLTKPLDIRALLAALQRVCAAPAIVAGPTDYTLGISAAMRQIEAMLPQIAATATSVLITGESGVGKEEVARRLHSLRDPDCRLPFVAVNCGALSEGLLEAELFGHVKGAFTGAVRDKKGVFELAHGGTLFLDEIGEMSPAMQVKLLRAIQERKVVRLGAERAIDVAIHLVCATHRDLKQMVEQGSFREDLYYRIHVVHLHVPALRERRDDILWLARRLLQQAADGKAARTLHPTSERALTDHPWPGNIRELKHCLERACVLFAANPLLPSMLFGDLPAPLPARDSLPIGPLGDFLSRQERDYIEAALAQHGGRIADTAAALGISRKNLWEKMKRLDIGERRG